MSTAFGLSFSSSLIVNDESQLHGTINGVQLSASLGSNSNSSSSSTSSSSVKLEAAASSSVAMAVGATVSSSLTTNQLVSPSSTNNNISPPPPTSSSTIVASSSNSPTSFKPTSSYESTHSRLIAGYPRLPGLYSSTYAAHSDQSSAFYQANSASFYPPLSSHYELDKSNGNSWTPLASQAPYSPYDPHHSFYGPYSNCYGAIDSAARRKNATRETTNTLKAWLYEHRKNPYPTKGEKIMLAIITKMTLTQVSTWFANARRRLKKENKMTWEPKNKSNDSRDNDSDKDSIKDIDEDIGINKNDNGNGLRIKDQEHRIGGQSNSSSHLAKGHLLSNHHGQVPPSALVPPPPLPSTHSQTFGLSVEGDNTMDGQRPKIWSLAQTATSEASASLAGRLYQAEWSAAAYAAQFQSGNMSENLSLINPLSEHYHHHAHHHHHHHHSGPPHPSSGSQHQHVQSPTSHSTTNHHHHFYPTTKPNGWNNEEPQNGTQPPSHHHLGRTNHSHSQSSNFGCSPVPFLPGNLQMSI